MRLVADQISHCFSKTQRILSDVDFSIDADGSSVAIVGPSGSGKTTFLSVLGGLLEPSSGSLYISDGAQHLSVARHVSWVLQTTNLLPRRSARDNVAMGALARGESLTDVLQRADVVLRQVGLGHAADKPARFLSGGETQRLSVARAVTSRTPFVLADEPTGQLDSRSSDQVAGVLFDTTNAFRCGLVLVTHDHTLADRCDRVLTLSNGSLQ